MRLLHFIRDDTDRGLLHSIRNDTEMRLPRFARNDNFIFSIINKSVT